jgi:uncharacterized protein (TIGR00266 family)
MRISIEAKPSYGMAVVTLDDGETLVAESGCMVAMTPSVSVDTTFNGTGGGGVFGWAFAVLVGLARKFLAGETMFVNRFSSRANGQQVMLSPAMVGDIVHLQMDGQRTITVQATSYLASAPTVDVALMWGGLSMFFSGEGAFFLRCTGRGDLLVNSYGAIEKVEINGKYVVDTGHVVAYEGELETTISRAGGSWFSTFFSGEGIVQTFEGRGTVWLQTRNLGSLVGWLRPLLP